MLARRPTGAAGRSVIIITHRLSSVRDVHRVMVLDQGEIVEQGTHVERLEKPLCAVVCVAGGVRR